MLKEKIRKTFIETLQSIGGDSVIEFSINFGLPGLLIHHRLHLLKILVGSEFCSPYLHFIILTDPAVLFWDFFQTSTICASLHIVRKRECSLIEQQCTSQERFISWNASFYQLNLPWFLGSWLRETAWFTEKMQLLQLWKANSRAAPVM